MNSGHFRSKAAEKVWHLGKCFWKCGILRIYVSKGGSLVKNPKLCSSFFLLYSSSCCCVLQLGCCWNVVVAFLREGGRWICRWWVLDLILTDHNKNMFFSWSNGQKQTDLCGTQICAWYTNLWFVHAKCHPKKRVKSQCCCQYHSNIYTMMIR
jgi:hypothetical protein